jgi:UDP-glucose 4-epimerase
MKKALVTGGQGFIGGHLVDRLIDDKYEVVVIDNQSSTCSEFHINAKAEYIDSDISDISIYQDLFDKHGRFDHVFHLAALSKVQESIERPAMAVFDNVLGSCNVLEYCRMTRPQKVVLSSTCSVYGLNENTPFKEDEPTDCLNPYSLTKNHAEELFQLYHKMYEVETLVLRYFNVFGPRAPKTGSYAPVVSKFMDQVKLGERPTVYGTGENTRDYVHVEDVVEANVLAANSSFSSSGQVFNVGTGKDYSVMQIADMVRGDLEVEYMGAKQGECKKVVADFSKIKKELNWRPKHSLVSYVKKELKSLTKDQQ